jgi:hypothetical protein
MEDAPGLPIRDPLDHRAPRSPRELQYLDFVAIPQKSVSNPPCRKDFKENIIAGLDNEKLFDDSKQDLDRALKLNLSEQIIESDDLSESWPGTECISRRVGQLPSSPNLLDLGRPEKALGNLQS